MIYSIFQYSQQHKYSKCTQSEYPSYWVSLGYSLIEYILST